MKPERPGINSIQYSRKTCYLYYTNPIKEVVEGVASRARAKAAFRSDFGRAQITWPAVEVDVPCSYEGVHLQRNTHLVSSEIAKSTSQTSHIPKQAAQNRPHVPPWSARIQQFLCGQSPK